MPYSENHTKTAQSPGYTVQNEVKNLLGSHFKNLESPSLRLNKMMIFPIQGAGELNAVCACINEHGKKTFRPCLRHSRYDLFPVETCCTDDD